MLPAAGITFNKVQDWKKIQQRQKIQTHKRQTETEEEEDVEGQRRRRTMSDSESEDDTNDEGSHEASERKGHHSGGVYIDQTVTLNGKDTSKKLELWVVHNDPNVSSAFAIAASTGDKLFSSDWKLHSTYCRDKKYGRATSYEEFGDCDDNIRDDIEKYITKYLSKQSEYCRKIVLCKNGAFKFVFKAGRFKDASDFDKIHISAARVTGDCKSKYCEFMDLVEVHINNGEYGGHRCPVPSIALDFSCHTHLTSRFRNMEGSFSEYQWHPKSQFWERGKFQYRVIPPQGPKKSKSKWFFKKSEEVEGEEEGGESNDPFKCDDKKSGRAYRPRFQIKETNGKIHTCCMKRIVPGEGLSIGYYWPDQMDTNINDEDFGSDISSSGGGKNQDPRFWNAIPESAIVGKAPSDKDFPKNIRDRVVGWRKDHGSDPREAYDKLVTKEEYDAIKANEAKVNDPANPDEHATSASFQTLNGNVLIAVSLILILISSVYLVVYV